MLFLLWQYLTSDLCQKACRLPAMLFGGDRSADKSGV